MLGGVDGLVLWSGSGSGMKWCRFAEENAAGYIDGDWGREWLPRRSSQRAQLMQAGAAGHWGVWWYRSCKWACARGA